MKSLPERPTSSSTLQDNEAARTPIDPRDILDPDVAERLLDVMARMVVIAARVRTERAAAEAER